MQLDDLPPECILAILERITKLDELISYTKGKPGKGNTVELN